VEAGLLVLFENTDFFTQEEWGIGFFFNVEGRETRK
jgi:hypothetical protein